MKIAEGIKVSSFIPGRLRLKVDDLRGNEDLAQKVEEELAAVAGINAVDASAASGSLLVRYDRKIMAETPSVKALAAALKRLFPQLDVDGVVKRFTKA